MSSVAHLLEDPFRNIDISLLIPSINFDNFVILYQSLLDGFSGSTSVEMLIKVDEITNIDRYYEICQNSPFKYKILVYPQFNGRHSLHIFFNDLGKLSSGKIVWFLNDDATVKGAWDTVLIGTLGSFDDNIFAIIIPFDNSKGTKQIVPLPAITKEWIKTIGYTTLFPNFDRWIDELSRGIGRRVIIQKEDLVVSMPKGHRVLSKEDRRKIFYPTLTRTLRKLRKKMK